MTMAVAGIGLVSPIAMDATQHALFVEAGLGRNPPTAFLSARDQPIFVHHAPWLGARMPVAERMAALGEAAGREALARAGAATQRGAAVVLCLGETDARPSDAELDAVSAHLARAFGLPVRARARGAASAFSALAAAQGWLDAAEVGAVLVVAADSLVTLDVAAAEQRRTPEWVMESPAPSEAAAAVLLVRDDARPGGAEVLGRVHGAAVMRGSGSDHDEAIVDGQAMTALLERVAPPAPMRVVRAYGQARVDDLRLSDWTYACARQVSRLHERIANLCVEAFVGRTGGAAGLVQVAYAIARERALPLDSLDSLQPGAGRVLCWAISADGTRGLTQLEVPTAKRGAT